MQEEPKQHPVVDYVPGEGVTKIASIQGGLGERTIRLIGFCGWLQERERTKRKLNGSERKGETGASKGAQVSKRTDSNLMVGKGNARPEF